MRKRRLRLGVAGLGRGFMLMLPTLAQHPKLKLVAAADPRPEARVRFAADFHAPAFETVGELCRDPDVEAIYIATPHQFHVEHVKLAAGAGKHVLVEKPMALSLTECRAMIEAARRGGIKIVVGHSHSFDRPYLRAREIIEEGHLGAVRMITALNYTDFLYRPRRPEELNTSEGGGVVWSQAAHQVDIVRLLAGGRVRTVRAATGRWDPTRPTEGAYSAFLTFEEGAFATLAYSGYGHFDSDEFGGWIGELGQTRQDRKYGEARRKLRTIKSPAEEAELKKTQSYGVDASAAAQYTKPHAHNHFGLIVISCERGDLRPLPNGVRVYTDDAEFLDKLPAGQVPRSEVIDELYDAAVDNRPTLHSGEWGLATTEVCLAILQSAAEGRELVLHEQVAALSKMGSEPLAQ
jgi:phthalate 4,5-cis-dihydrodiol dehydrogenase